MDYHIPGEEPRLSEEEFLNLQQGTSQKEMMTKEEIKDWIKADREMQAINLALQNNYPAIEINFSKANIPVHDSFQAWAEFQRLMSEGRKDLVAEIINVPFIPQNLPVGYEEIILEVIEESN